MQILTANHWTELRDPYGRVRERSEGNEGDGNPIGRPTVSTNLDSWELPETKPPTKSICRLVRRHSSPLWHISSRGLPCLVSVGDDVPNPIEPECTRMVEYERSTLSEGKGRRMGVEFCEEEQGGRATLGM